MPSVIAIDAVRQDPNSQIRLTSEDGAVPSIIGFITDDMQVSGAAEYNAPFETAMAKQSIRLNALTTLANDWFGAKIPQMQLKSRAHTVNMWVSSQRPSFLVSFLYPALREGEDIVDNVKYLVGATYPDAEDGAMTTLLEAPNGYAVGAGGAQDLTTGTSLAGTWMLEYGRWFRATNLVLRSASATMSKEITPYSGPLYAKIDVTLEPYRLISAEEFHDYFL